MINAARLTTPKDAFEARGIRSVPVDECDTILVFAGLPDEYESEGYDRENMRLPESQLREIDALCESGKPVVVVLFGGAPVELPFRDKVDAILNMYLPGQNGGTAVAQLLFGEVNPSGKLAETWPLRYEDVPSAANFGSNVNEVYSEGTEVGYRYFNKHDIPVCYPFGHGLSYTTFEKTEWTQQGDAYTQTIANTGERFGAKVAMLFIDGELAGFQKVWLQPGESVSVTIVPEAKEKTVWPDELVIPPELPRLPITLESRFSDLQQTFFGRIIRAIILPVATKQADEVKNLPDGPEKDNVRKGAVFLRRALESSSLRTLSMAGGTRMPYNLAQCFVELSNGHLIRAAKAYFSPIRVPKLPKEE